MTIQTFANGRVWFPNAMPYASVVNTAGGLSNTATAGTMDAATEKIAFVGYCEMGGATGKVISAAGGGNIQARTGAVTWAGTTTVQVGIQDVSTSGPAVQPDGSFDVSRNWVRGADALSSNTWTTFTMTGGSGTKTLAQNDLIAVVFDMTVRGGSDSVAITAWTAPIAQSVPGVALNLAGAWGTTAVSVNPNVLIVTDDGTRVGLSGLIAAPTIAALAYSDSSGTDEYGIVFQVPFPCRVDKIRLHLIAASGAADGTLSLYSTPLGTPSAMATVTVRGEQVATSSASRWIEYPITPQSLSANTDYCVALRATTANNLTIPNITLNNANDKAVLPGGMNVRAASRNNGAGSFTVNTTQYFIIDVGITGFDDGTTVGGGGIRVAGHGGLAA